MPLDSTRLAASHQEPDPLDLRAVELGELARALLIEMPPLSPMQRRVIDLLLFGGCHMTEAASVLGISLSSLRTHKKRALRKLASVTHLFEG